MNMAAKVAAGGVLALIGFMVLKFVLGVMAFVGGLLFLLLFRVLPIVLLVWFGIWVMRKVFGRDGSTATS